MARIQTLVTSLILGASIIGCAADPSPSKTEPGTDDTASVDPTTPPTPATAEPATPSDPATTEPTPSAPQVTHPAASPACSAGGLFCCNAVVSANVPAVTALLTLLGINVALLTEDVGVTCTTSASVASCAQVPACCTSNVLNLVALDCSSPASP